MPCLLAAPVGSWVNIFDGHKADILAQVGQFYFGGWGSFSSAVTPDGQAWPLGLLEVLSPVAGRWPWLEPQARASGMLQDETESAPQDEETLTDS